LQKREKKEARMIPFDPSMGKEERRLRRQITALASSLPWLERGIHRLLDNRMRLVRLPLGIRLIAAGLLGFLPVLGFWMLPLGLLLLALDLPALRPPVSAATIRTRRRVRTWWRGRRSD
jgi:hypothetical protein